MSVQNVVKKLQIMIMTSSQSRLHLITQEDLNVLVGKFTQGQSELASTISVTTVKLLDPRKLPNFLFKVRSSRPTLFGHKMNCVFATTSLHFWNVLEISMTPMTG